jgi:flavin reductase (DIM6/NTAB) family NADH-FMN oxidoreductase RutF
MQRVDPVAFRQAASRFATGVAVVTALDRRGEVCGMTANSFVTISLSPPTVLVSVRSGKTHEAISAGKRYGVNVLPKDGKGLSRHFAGHPGTDPPHGCEIVQGLPRLSNCVAFFACEVTRIVDVSDHTLFIAEVSNCDYCDSLPLVFFSSRYHLGPGIQVDQ